MPWKQILRIFLETLVFVVVGMTVLAVARGVWEIAHEAPSIENPDFREFCLKNDGFYRFDPVNYFGLSGKHAICSLPSGRTLYW